MGEWVPWRATDEHDDQDGPMRTETASVDPEAKIRLTARSKQLMKPRQPSHPAPAHLLKPKIEVQREATLASELQWMQEGMALVAQDPHAADQGLDGAGQPRVRGRRGRSMAGSGTSSRGGPSGFTREAYEY